MADGLVGRQLGQYEVIERIGAGGMATVFKGYRADIDRTVAIKVLKINPAIVDENLTARFQLEARTIARLQHPHILPLYDYGVEDDILYLVMAYLEGGSLGDRLRNDQVPTLEEVSRILNEIAGALDYAHRQGIIHRDIKPDNILFDGEGHALLADFGIAKIAENDDRLTVTGGIVGTPAYLAPEQGRGEGVKPSSDIYSLGVVIYEVLTGEQPFKANTPVQVIMKHINDPLPDFNDIPTNLPNSLEPVLRRVLAKSADQRYQTVTDFAEDFARAIAGDPLAADTRTVVPKASSTRKSDQEATVRMQTTQPGDEPTAPQQTMASQSPATTNRMPLVIGGLVVLLILVGIGVYLTVGSETPPTPTDEPAVVAESPAAETFGRLTFNTTNATGDTVVMRVDDLSPPGGGNVYAAWLQNTETDETLFIGELNVDPFGSGNLPPYTDAEERVLPALYNAVIITEEAEIGDTPTGDVVYQGALPQGITDTFTSLFVTSPQGVNEERSLYDSVIGEAENAQTHAGLAQGSTTAGSMHSHAEHTVNIINGTDIDYNGNGRPENPGFGLGVLPLLDVIEAELDELATQPDADTALQSNVEFARVCIVNSRNRANRIVEIEEQLLASDDVEAVADVALESTEIATALIEGTDVNDNGQVDPFENECGLEQLQSFSLLISTMNLVQAE